MSGCPRGLWLRYARPGSRFADVSAIRAIDAVDRGVPPDAPTRMTARLLDTDSHGLYASGGSPWPVRSGWMSCRCGAGCARRRDWAGRVGGDEDPSPRLQAYGKARLPDEVSRTGAGCTAGRGHAQATPLVAQRRLVLEQAPSLNQKRTCSTHGLPWTGWSGLFMRSSSLCWVG